MEDVADLVNLVESLMDYLDRKPNSSFTRRSSVRRSGDLSRKGIDVRANVFAKSMPAKSRGDHTEANQSKISDKDADGADGISRLSLEQELIAVKQQVKDLQKKLLEKDELLKAAEGAMNQMNLLQSNYDELV